MTAGDGLPIRQEGGGHTRLEELGLRILAGCREELYGYFPYLDGAFAGLGYEISEEIKGIGTDGEHIVFAPEFLVRAYADCPGEVRRGYLHMLLHCLFLHPFQGQKEEAKLWNIACDMAVEQAIENSGHFPENKDTKDLKRQEYLMCLGKKAMSAEQIFGLLREGGIPYEMEELEETFHFDAHALWHRKPGTQAGAREKWQRLLTYTVQGRERQKRRAGTASGNKEEELQAIYRKRYDYRKFLKKFAFPREEVELDTESFDYIFYSYGMEHYGNIPLIEPLEYKEVNRLEELVIAIDTSGSCSREMVQSFLGETYGILSTRENFFKKMNVHILQCDCCIQNAAVIHSEEEWKEYSSNVKIEGRGGTDFRPVFRYVREQRERKLLGRLKALIYFTDGDGIYPREKPDFETAFVFLEKTEAMKMAPGWAYKLVISESGGKTAGYARR